MAKINVIPFLHAEREKLFELMMHHYFSFAAYFSIMVIDIFIMMMTNTSILKVYAWAGLFLLMFMSAIEMKQVFEYKMMMDNIDKFYLSLQIKADRGKQ